MPFKLNKETEKTLNLETKKLLIEALTSITKSADDLEDRLTPTLIAFLEAASNQDIVSLVLTLSTNAGFFAARFDRESERPGIESNLASELGLEAFVQGYKIGYTANATGPNSRIGRTLTLTKVLFPEQYEKLQQNPEPNDPLQNLLRGMKP